MFLLTSKFSSKKKNFCGFDSFRSASFANRPPNDENKGQVLWRSDFIDQPFFQQQLRDVGDAYDLSGNYAPRIGHTQHVGSLPPP